jgi:hypothetical protein
MFNQSVPGAYNRTFTRSNTHLACCPTDNQAEVLIPDTISMGDIFSIAVKTKTQATNEAARLSLLGVPEDRFNFIIAPTLFEKYNLKECISSGKRPQETLATQRKEA